MTFPLYEDAILMLDMPEEGLAGGDISTVAERHNMPDFEIGYSIEFFDLLGNTVDVVTLPVSSLRLPVPSYHLVARTTKPALSRD